jgi:hypothetical protein
MLLSALDKRKKERKKNVNYELNKKREIQRKHPSVLNIK